MDQQVTDIWANTLTAQTGAYQGLTGFNTGNYFLSIFLVIGLLLFVFWLLNKFGWIKKQTPSEPEEERLLFYAQFNQQETLVVTEQDKKINCLIVKGKDVVLATELPMLTAKKERSGNGQSKSSNRRGMTFHETWMNVLQGRKGKR